MAAANSLAPEENTPETEEEISEQDLLVKITEVFNREEGLQRAVQETQDPQVQKVRIPDEEGIPRGRTTFSRAECSILNERLYIRRRLYAPDTDGIRHQIVKLHHTHLTAGHSGIIKTFSLISRYYFWPEMRKFVKRYVQNCHTCDRTTFSRQGPYGSLKPLPVPDNR